MRRISNSFAVGGVNGFALDMSKSHPVFSFTCSAVTPGNVSLRYKIPVSGSERKIAKSLITQTSPPRNIPLLNRLSLPIPRIPHGLVKYSTCSGKRLFSCTIETIILSARLAILFAPPLPVIRALGPFPVSDTATGQYPPKEVEFKLPYISHSAAPKIPTVQYPRQAIVPNASARVDSVAAL